MKLPVKRLVKHAVLPAYQTSGSAAFDLAIIEDIAIPPRGSVKKGIDLANSIGVIDSDYRGPEDEILLVLVNLTEAEVRLEKGDRVAQGMIIPVVQAEITEIERIEEPSRGGFGTTGR